MPINGNGIATSTGKQLLQIIPINIVTMVTVIACAVGLYYKFDARISALEKISSSEELLMKVNSLESKMNESTQRIVRIDTNLNWIMLERQKEK